MWVGQQKNGFAGDCVGEKEGLRSFSIVHMSVPLCGKILVKQAQKSELEVVRSMHVV